MRSIGIDIGTFSIKVVELEVSSRTTQLMSCIEVPLNPDPTFDRRVPTLEVLKRIAEQYDPSQTVVTMCVAQQHVSLRHKVFPFRERHKILKSLPFELEDDLPFDLENTSYEAKILNYRKNSSEVLALACPHSYLNEILDLSKTVGLDPDIISSEAIALSCLFEDWSSPPQEVIDPSQHIDEEGTSTGASFKTDPAQLLLHIGNERTVLVALHKGKILTSRTLFFGGQNLVKTLQKQYNTPYVEAVKALIEKGFVLTNSENTTADQTAFSNALSLTLLELTEDIKRIILEIQSDFKVSFSQIYLSGGVSQLLNIGPFFTQQFEVPCNVIEPFTPFNPNIDASLQSKASLALGLAIEGARKPNNPAVNFRRGILSKENESLKFFWEKWNYTAKLAGVALLVLFIAAVVRENLSFSLSDASYDVIRTKAQEVGLKRNQATPSQVKRFIREQEREVKKRKMLAGLRDLNGPFDIMTQLTSMVPVKERIQLDIRRFYLLNDTLTIEGQVSTRESLEELKRSLTSLAVDRKLQDLAPSFQADGGKLAFSMALKVNRKLQKGAM